MPRSLGPVGRFDTVVARKKRNFPLLTSFPGAVALISAFTPRMMPFGCSAHAQNGVALSDRRGAPSESTACASGSTPRLTSAW